MMNRRILFVFASVSVVVPSTAAPPQTAVIPVGVKNRDHFYVNATFPNLYGNSTIVQLNLSPGALSGSSVLGTRRHGSTRVSVQPTWLHTLGDGQLRFEDQRHRFTELDRDYFSNSVEHNTPQGYLGIGIGSSLSSDGSVEFLRDYRGISNTTIPLYMLNVNSPSHAFINGSCVPGSVMSIPIVTGSADSLTTITRLAFQLGTTTTMNLDFDNVSLRSSPYMFTLPYRLYAIILDSGLPHAVLGGSRQYSRFQNCNVLRTTFPTIHLNFESSGYLIIPPDDYLVDIGDDRCELLVTQVPDGGTPFINPLMIPGMNIRFTAESVLFCDSAL